MILLNIYNNFEYNNKYKKYKFNYIKNLKLIDKV